MPSKQVTISARISDEDAAFLSGLAMGDAKTPSDKLRAIIAEARQRSQHTADYAGSLQAVQDMVQPVLRLMRNTEVENQVHSEVMSRFSEWIPDALAFLISSFSTADDEHRVEHLRQLESGVVDRLIRLMTAVLQLSITDQCACYDPAIMKAKIGPVLELSRIIIENSERK
ncbi:conserved hypothetical protein [Desulfosarcina cetonica]|uniref:hypothetical protein n=1 Tax=Desulfosarcina cetonica TaxID=90730 RepID=UPI0006D25C8B|nr:hypothetical protein [Desulfosarcina cetonica]VTR68726.1 conserved hypothetical protein [Desulfosarcina cetonica]